MPHNAALKTQDHSKAELTNKSGQGIADPGRSPRSAETQTTNHTIEVSVSEQIYRELQHRKRHFKITLSESCEAALQTVLFNSRRREQYRQLDVFLEKQARVIDLLVYLEKRFDALDSAVAASDFDTFQKLVSGAEIDRFFAELHNARMDIFTEIERLQALKLPTEHQENLTQTPLV